MTATFRKFMILCAMLIALSAGAQQDSTETTTEASSTTAETAETTTAPATTTASSDEPEGRAQVRAKLATILERIPPHVAKAIKLDPSLWSNQTYLSQYPALAEFAKKHPEVAFHKDYYLDMVWIPSDYRPESSTERVVEMISIFLTIAAIATAFAWLIKTVIDHRRWARMSKIQTDMHTKLLDRFGSNEEMMKYIQTEAGKQFLTASPINTEPPRTALNAPIGRVLWSVQVGTVLAALGFGMMLVSWRLDKEGAEVMSVLGTLALSLGVGFAVAAALSFVLSRKLGLWQPPAPIGDTDFRTE